MIEQVLLNPSSSGLLAYVVIFLALIGGSIGLPIPEDLPLIASGVLAHRGQARLDVIAVVCYVAILIGDIIIFWAGRHFGPGLLRHRWIARSISAERVSRVRLQLERRSLIMIFLARHLFYIRTVTFLVCGVVRMNFARFLLADAISALISVPLMIGIGLLFSENLEAILELVQHSRFYVLLALVAVTAFGLGRWLKRRAAKQEQTERGDHLAESLLNPTTEQLVGTDGLTRLPSTEHGKGDTPLNGTVNFHPLQPHEDTGTVSARTHRSPVSVED